MNDTKEAIKNKDVSNLIIHSDHGYQYSSIQFNHKNHLTMKPFNRFLQLSLIVSLLFLFSCGGPSYNTDYEPPSQDADINEVFPETISGLEREVTMLDIDKDFYLGVQAKYGDDIVIEIIITKPEADHNKYIEDFLVPEIDKLSNNFRGNINGKWAGRGNDGDFRLYAWEHQRHLYKIKAKEEVFEDAVLLFNFISAE